MNLVTYKIDHVLYITKWALSQKYDDCITLNRREKKYIIRHDFWNDDSADSLPCKTIITDEG